MTDAYEKTDVNVKKLFLVTLVVLVFVVIVIVAMNELFIFSKESQVYQAVLKPESAELRDLRAKEAEALHTYKALDAAKGVYQIPIDRAMALIAEEAFAEKMKDEM
ncbi:hypothetical protein A2V82_05860 [candidate division KSB1 bacterium RBG_16_48_16]|nr:MAG: hypothetical protein A2V82_05860 [candidate division KSB1 bacterium RBG_16_48_16]